MKDVDTMDFDSCYFIATYGLGANSSFQMFDDFTELAIPYDRRGLSFEVTNSIGTVAQIFMSWVSFADMDGEND